MNALRDGTVATDGAYLTYQQVQDAGEPRGPLQEDFRPDIQRGRSNTVAMVVEPPPHNRDPPAMEQIYLVKAENPEHAYWLYGKPSKLLGHAAGWGEIQFAVIFPRKYSRGDGGGEVLTFRKPDPNEAKLVAIKQVNKNVARQYLAMGGHEDPWKEVSRMQQLGDEIHVLKCIEALEDDTFLYIVTPYSHEGSLVDNIPWGTGYPEAKAKAIFKNILEILLYLEQHGIYHHDLAPDNFLFFQDRLLLFDFAMSIRIPREPNGQRRLMPPEGAIYGTPPCLDPCVFHNEWPFDGVFADLWASGTILYALLTGLVLYRFPHWADIHFRCFIMAEGLQPDSNLGIFLLDWFQPGNDQRQHNLVGHAMANAEIPLDALEVLINLLKLDRAARWTLMQTVQSAWVQS